MNSPFLQSVLCQYSSSSSYYSPVLYPSHQKVPRKKRASVISYFWNGGRPFDERCPFQRRVVLLVGVSVLPFLQLRDVAAEEPAEVFNAESHVGGFANIFLSQRNRSKDVKPRSANVMDNSVFEGGLHWPWIPEWIVLEWFMLWLPDFLGTDAFFCCGFQIWLD